MTSILKGRRFQGRVLGRSNNNANVNAGVAYSNTNNASTNSNTNNGGRLCIPCSASDCYFSQLKLNRLYGNGHVLAKAEGEKPEPRQQQFLSSLQRIGKNWKAETSKSAA